MGDSRILYQTEDSYGPILVTEEDGQRTMAFAEHDAQGCSLKSAPHIAQYEYTQAMLLVLLFRQPKRVTLLGLGVGNLLTALHHQVPGIHITGVELRQAVIDIAYRYFQMPRGKRLTIVNQDANDFLNEHKGRKVDVIFADLYHADGVDETQLQADFVARCAGQLKADGWLVLNGWTEHRNNEVFLGALRAHFVDVRTVLTGSLNWVVFAGKVEDMQSASALKDKASRLSGELGFALAPHFGRMSVLAKS